MNPNGVRLECPECTWQTVVTEDVTADPHRLPDGVNKRVGNEFYCPNCALPMKPIASVETRTGPALVKPDEMTMEQWREKLGELERECEQSEARWKRLKEAAKDAKEDYDAKVVTLRTALRRFTHGVTEDPKPLLDIAENEGEGEEECEEECGALHPTMGLRCTEAAGHEGDHARTSMDLDDDESLVTWPQTVVEQAAALAASGQAGEVAEQPEPQRYPRRGRKSKPADVEEPSIANA